MMTSTTEKLVNELNAMRRLEYPAKGFLLFQDVRGDGRNIRSLYVIINDEGGVTYSEHNGETPRKRCASLRAAIETESKAQDDADRDRDGVTLAHDPARPWFPDDAAPVVDADSFLNDLGMTRAQWDSRTPQGIDAANRTAHALTDLEARVLGDNLQEPQNPIVQVLMSRGYLKTLEGGEIATTETGRNALNRYTESN